VPAIVKINHVRIFLASLFINKIFISFYCRIVSCFIFGDSIVYNNVMFYINYNIIFIFAFRMNSEE
jgi:hypothetical protein